MRKAPRSYDYLVEAGAPGLPAPFFYRVLRAGGSIRVQVRQRLPLGSTLVAGSVLTIGQGEDETALDTVVLAAADAYAHSRRLIELHGLVGDYVPVPVRMVAE